MSVKIKMTALLSCLVLLCSCFISCVTPPDNNNNQGGLPSDKYLARMQVVYETEDEKLAAVVSAMGENSSTVSVNGDDLKIVSSVNVQGIALDDEYLYIGDTLYRSTTLTVEGKSATTFEKAAMSDTDRDNLLSKAGPGASVTVNDFLKFDKAKVGNLTTYTCSNMLKESKDSLAKIFAAKLSSIGATVTVDSASYLLEVVDDRNASSTLTCNLIISMDGVDYELTLKVFCKYDYDAEISISAPQNADKYSEVELAEIIG